MMTAQTYGWLIALAFSIGASCAYTGPTSPRTRAVLAAHSAPP